MAKDHEVSTDVAQSESMTERAALALIRKLLDVGLDGLGPVDSVGRVVDDTLDKVDGDREKAIARICRSHVRYAATGGFVTGVGGLFTMPVALPANIIEFYVLATRMVGGVASLRGYDVNRPEVRSAVLLTLIGSASDEVLAKAGVATGGRMAQMAMQRLPKAALMVVNKGVAFRLSSHMGTRALSRFTRALPLVGGAVGAGMDTYLMRQIARLAREEFPPVEQMRG